ncbi:hypothetical protein ACTMTF_16430 [Nonomuraea sp. ZG12]|uniref:hypothetical protein n=1 Tax=Nonomuraea sp. ZG12 TaxID=3452207 RepID=UPI003F8938CE
MRKFMVILAAVAALFAGGLPASAAGGWAVTYLDPVPGAFAPRTSYTIGFWVLQHGVRPFEGDLGTTGLKLTDAKGRPMTFEGTPLPEAGHYATAVNLPKGTYRIEGVQGIFPPYEIGTLTVPGGVEIRPVPPEMVRNVGAGEKNPWGAVRPPGFPEGEGEPEALVGASAAPTAAAPVASPRVVASQAGAAQEPVADREGPSPYALLLAAVGGALLTLLAVRSARRGREADPSEPTERSSDAPSEGQGDTIVFKG